MHRVKGHSTKLANSRDKRNSKKHLNRQDKMKTKTIYLVTVTRNQYRTSNSNLVKTIGRRAFGTREAAEAWIGEKAKELQAEEIAAQTCESEEMMQEMIDNGFELETYGNKTYAPFNNGAARKGYYEFVIG